jgi:hypothetical protein
MADFKKLRRNLPMPPTAAEASANLRAPETAPADGRSMRATGRTYPLGTRVREEWHAEVKLYAAQHRMKMVEVLEQAFEALKDKSKQEK